MKLLSRVRLLVTAWTAAYQAPPSMGFSRQEYWSGVPSPSLWDAEGTAIKTDLGSALRKLWCDPTLWSCKYPSVTGVYSTTTVHRTLVSTTQGVAFWTLAGIRITWKVCNHLLSSTPWYSDLEGLRQDLRLRISNKHWGGADPGVFWPHFEQHRNEGEKEVGLGHHPQLLCSLERKVWFEKLMIKWAG